MTNPNPNPDYCIVAFFLVLVVATVEWFFVGRKRFTGPAINVQALQNGEAVGITTEANRESAVESLKSSELESKAR